VEEVTGDWWLVTGGDAERMRRFALSEPGNANLQIGKSENPERHSGEWRSRVLGGIGLTRGPPMVGKILKI